MDEPFHVTRLPSDPCYYCGKRADYQVAYPALPCTPQYACRDHIGDLLEAMKEQLSASGRPTR